MTESYFVSARAEMSVRVSDSAVGNVDVPVSRSRSSPVPGVVVYGK